MSDNAPWVNFYEWVAGLYPPPSTQSQREPPPPVVTPIQQPTQDKPQ